MVLRSYLDSRHDFCGAAAPQRIETAQPADATRCGGFLRGCGPAAD